MAVTLGALLAGCAGLLAIVLGVANMAAFTSIKRGLSFIDWFYPWKQNHAAFKAQPRRIQGHIFSNGAALLIGTYALIGARGADGSSFRASLDDPLYVAFLGTLFVGCVTSIQFSVHNPAHNMVSTTSFAFMAAGACVPALGSLYAAGVLGDDALAHAHMIRSYASMWGAFVGLRLLGLVWMPMVPPAQKHAAWIALIWASWWIPSAICDLLFVPGLSLLRA